jgi:hypothetical protein
LFVHYALNGFAERAGIMLDHSLEARLGITGSLRATPICVHGSALSRHRWSLELKQPRLGSRNFDTAASISPIPRDGCRLRGQVGVFSATGVIKIEQTASDEMAQ